MTRLFAIVSYLTFRGRGAIWVACLVSAVSPLNVRAQATEDRVVIPVVIESAGSGSDAFRRSARIREARGADFRSIEETRAAFVARASAAPIELQAEDIDRWLDHKEAATKHLAHQDYARAAASLRPPKK